MKRILPCTLALLLGLAGVCAGQDMRALQTEARRARAELQEKVTAEKQAAEQEAQQIQRQIMADRHRLERAVAQLEQKTAALSKTVAAEKEEHSRLQDRQEELSRTLAETDSVMRELVGVIRVNAKDIQALATEQAKAIAEALAHKQPEQKDYFKTHFRSLEKDLLALDSRIRTVVSSNNDTPIIFSHPVYEYFEQTYSLNGSSVHWEPDQDPRPDQVAGLKAENPINSCLITPTFRFEPQQSIRINTHRSRLFYGPVERIAHGLLQNPSESWGISL